MKKTIFSLLMSIMLTGCLSLGTLAVNESEIDIRAKAAVLMDASMGQVLYSFNENEKL